MSDYPQMIGCRIFVRRRGKLVINNAVWETTPLIPPTCTDFPVRTLRRITLLRRTMVNRRPSGQSRAARSVPPPGTPPSPPPLFFLDRFILQIIFCLPGINAFRRPSIGRDSLCGPEPLPGAPGLDSETWDSYAMEVHIHDAHRRLCDANVFFAIPLYRKRTRYRSYSYQMNQPPVTS
jgi:hypothetical protein